MLDTDRSPRAGDVIGNWTLVSYEGAGLWVRRCRCGALRRAGFSKCWTHEHCSDCAYKKRLANRKPTSDAPPPAPPSRPKARLHMRDVRALVCARFNITPEQLVEKTRAKRRSRPRQMAMTLARETTAASYPAVAQFFGVGDHTSAIYAQDRIYELEDESFPLASHMEQLRLALLTFKAQQEVTLMDEARP